MTARRLWIVVCLLAVFLLAAGCQRDSAGVSKASAVAAAPRGDAADRLRQVIDRYQTTPQYRDRGMLRLQYHLQGRPVVDESEVTIAFTRPDRLRLSIVRGINRLTVVSDGSHLWASVADPVSDDLRHQLVQRPAAERLSVGEIYAATEMLDPAQPNQMQSVLMGLPLNLYTSQLGLCLTDSALLDLLKRSAKTQWLEPETIDSVVCDRVQFAVPAGHYVVWIDRQSGHIRRIEYPTKELFEAVAAEQRPQSVQLTLDLADISFRPIEAAEFTFSPPENARVVQYFVFPPTVLPSDLFGKRTPPMTFVDLAGQDHSNQQWDDKIQVLLWFDRHAPSQVNVARLEHNFRQYSQLSDRVLFRLICAEPPAALPTAELQTLIDQWGMTIPVLRDVHAAGRDALKIDQAPTAVVLDANRVLHLFEVGANDQVDQAIQVVLGRLLAGENVAADVLRNAQAAEERFGQQLQLAAAAADPAAAEPGPELAPAADFEKLEAQVVWRNEDLDAPGNLLIVAAPGAGGNRLLVLNAMQEVVELDDSGQVAARHKLDLPDAAFVGQLGHAVDRQGVDYYWGFSQLGRQVYVFDAQFRKVLQYPPADQRHNGVMDAELLDLDDDGRLELYVGFADPHGCQRVELNGQRRWSNRTLPTTLSIAARQVSGFSQLYASGESGWLLPIDLEGRSGQPVTIAQRTVHQLESSESRRPRPSHFLGMSYSIEGRLIAVGLSANLEEQWAYGLPQGVFRHQVQSPRWVPLWGTDRGAWLLAGPDGSVHVVRDDGQFFDLMATGAEVLGIAGHARDGGLGRLYVTTPQTISAYDVGQVE